MKYTFYFYTLSCPIDGKVKYVGMTLNFETRIIQHLTGNDGTFEKNRWLNMLRDKGLKPIAKIEIEKLCTRPQASKIEKSLAKKYIKEGHDLFNGTLNKKRTKLMKGISMKYLSLVRQKCRELGMSEIEYLKANKEEAKANPSYLVAEARKRKAKEKARGIKKQNRQGGKTGGRKKLPEDKKRVLFNSKVLPCTYKNMVYLAAEQNLSLGKYLDIIHGVKTE